MPKRTNFSAAHSVLVDTGNEWNKKNAKRQREKSENVLIKIHCRTLNAKQSSSGRARLLMFRIWRCVYLKRTRRITHLIKNDYFSWCSVINRNTHSFQGETANKQAKESERARSEEEKKRQKQKANRAHAKQAMKSFRLFSFTFFALCYRWVGFVCCCSYVGTRQISIDTENT